MAYAMLDDQGRIVMWSHDPLDGLDVEFTNGDYIDEMCIDGVEDFIIENGEAVYSPLPEKEVAKLKSELEADDYIVSKFMREWLTSDDDVDLNDLHSKYRAEYGSRMRDNNTKVARINELS